MPHTQPEKIYIIVEVNWEYNDEYYYRPNGEGGSPIEAYYDKQKADERCKQLNAEKTAQNDGMYMDGDGYDENGQEDPDGYYGPPCDPFYEVKAINAPKE